MEFSTSFRLLGVEYDDDWVVKSRITFSNGSSTCVNRGDNFGKFIDRVANNLTNTAATFVLLSRETSQILANKFHYRCELL